MVRDKFSISWGDTGTKPTDGEDFESGERPDAQKFDWKWYNTIDKINKIWDELTRLDSNDDGQVDAADTADYANDADASTYKNNDIDSDGDGKVDAADDADTLGGESASAFADSNHGNEEHSSTFTTLTEVNNNADVPDADYADSAGNADTVDGEHAGAFADSNHGNEEHSSSFTTLTEVNNNADVPNADYADNADKVDGYHGDGLTSPVARDVTGNVLLNSSSPIRNESRGTITVSQRNTEVTIDSWTENTGGHGFVETSVNFSTTGYPTDSNSTKQIMRLYFDGTMVASRETDTYLDWSSSVTALEDVGQKTSVNVELTFEMSNSDGDNDITLDNVTTLPNYTEYNYIV